MTKREDTWFMGQIIGTQSGWDEADSFAVQAYDFKPNDLGAHKYKLKPVGCLVLAPFHIPNEYDDTKDVIYEVTKEGEKGQVFFTAE